MHTLLPRFGLIGTGAWANMIYAPVAAKSSVVNFTSVHGRNLGAMTALAEAFGATAYPDLGAFLDSVDIVGFCLPPDVQAKFALAAAAAGKHIILEKPISLDPADADAIADAVESRALRSVVFFTRLFRPDVAAWVREVRTGTWLFARSQSFSRLLLDSANPFNGTAWRHSVGSLWDSAPHAVALLQASLGDVAEVSAIRGTGDFVSMTLRHRGGTVSTISTSFDAPQVFPGELVLFGESGQLSPPPQQDWARESSEAFEVALRAVVVTDEAHDPLPNANFGARVTAVLAAAAKSIESGRRVELRY